MVSAAFVVMVAVVVGALCAFVAEATTERARLRRARDAQRQREDARVARDLRIYEFQKRGR
jgi:hypothetical protein